MNERFNQVKNIWKNSIKVFTILMSVIIVSIGLFRTSDLYAGSINTQEKDTYSSSTKYNREKHYGKSWIDTDNNGCDTRNDVLNRDLIHKQTGQGRHSQASCNNVVYKGVLHDKYTGEKITFTRGGGKHRDGGIQIDHVVALKDSWNRGAYKWSKEQRIKFANDTDNLIATKSEINMDKGAKTTKQWLPPQAKFRCEYVKTYNKVLKKYDLHVTKTDLEVEKRVCRN